MKLPGAAIYLVANDLGESEKYTLTMEAIRQGRVFTAKKTAYIGKTR